MLDERHADPNYHIYLLRVWRENADAEWRTMLQETRSGERRAFTDIEALLCHIRQLHGQLACDDLNRSDL